MAITKYQRVEWKNKAIGDYAHVVFEYEGNTEVRIIPRAKGVKIRSTKELGGGMLSINVMAFVEKDSRFDLESFFNNLDSNFSLNEEGDLKITDSNGTVTLTDCYLESFDQDQEHFRWSRFSLKFVKSL